jgi:hypothetical protein
MKALDHLEGLVQVLCSKGLTQAARDVLESVEDAEVDGVDLFHHDEISRLYVVVCDNEQLELDRNRVEAMELLGECYSGPLPEGFNLTPADVKSAKLEKWTIRVVEVRGRTTAFCHDRYKSYFARYERGSINRAGGWTLYNGAAPLPDSVAAAPVALDEFQGVSFCSVFATLRAAMAYASMKR